MKEHQFTYTFPTYQDFFHWYISSGIYPSYPLPIVVNGIKYLSAGMVMTAKHERLENV